MTESKPLPRSAVGLGAAACAVCCAAPLLGLMGIALGGVSLAIATAAFAGVTFGVAVLAMTVAGVVLRRRRTQVCRPQGEERLQVESGPRSPG